MHTNYTYTQTHKHKAVKRQRIGFQVERITTLKIPNRSKTTESQ